MNGPVVILFDPAYSLAYQSFLSNLMFCPDHLVTLTWIIGPKFMVNPSVWIFNLNFVDFALNKKLMPYGSIYTNN